MSVQRTATINAMIAGFIASLSLAAALLFKSALGLMPALDLIALWNLLMGSSAYPYAGWLAFFGLGTIVWGAAFAWAHPHFQGNDWVRGMTFGAATWIASMVLFMPFAGAGLFGWVLGPGVPLATLAMHLFYGAILGGVTGWLSANAAPGRPAFTR
jgi:hypothetical protein